MQIIPYLSFKGDCKEAFTFYQQCLGGTIEAMIPNEGTPVAEYVPVEWRSKIMHANLNVNGARLMGSDTPPEYYQGQPEGFNVSLHFEDAAEGRRVFNALSENGTVTMPFQKTFSAEGFGMCTDQFGIPWMINCRNEG